MKNEIYILVTNWDHTQCIEPEDYYLKLDIIPNNGEKIVIDDRCFLLNNKIISLDKNNNVSKILFDGFKEY